MTEDEWRACQDSMTEHLWSICDRVRSMLHFLTYKFSERKSRLFAVACVRRLQRFLTDPRSFEAVDVAERFADRKASYKELVAAERAAEKPAALLSKYDVSVAAAIAAVSAAGTLQPPFEIAFGTALVAAETIRHAGGQKDARNEEVWQCMLLRDIFGNLFRPVTLDASWLTPTVKALAQAIYEDRNFTDLLILADALEEVACNNEDILNHLRSPGSHCRGCWPLDLILGKT